MNKMNKSIYLFIITLMKCKSVYVNCNAIVPIECLRTYMRVSWNFVNDIMKTPLVVMKPMEHLAILAVEMSLRFAYQCLSVFVVNAGWKNTTKSELKSRMDQIRSLLNAFLAGKNEEKYFINPPNNEWYHEFDKHLTSTELNGMIQQFVIPLMHDHELCIGEKSLLLKQRPSDYSDLLQKYFTHITPETNHYYSVQKKLNDK
ncbi:hypothetical protein RFI_02955 [Reticulomyxa filosa]|uniref:Uncharacterized protein n=1 Tax=Reticulomyxa filosa TaxID=46433 RepID=X6P7U4_RETFI|nr:hypothetical protein RFI_02955 [Reticulomyxa filosa]|eukprot:ETO34139.1 hypothetical protein RFI_02955 [Reticulomyxa filosa]